MTKSPEKILFRAALLIQAVLLAVFLGYVPLCLDDLWFMDGIYTPAGPDTFRAACGVLVERLTTDTGRLGAIISPVFLALLPKWVYNVLTGVMFFLLVKGSCRLAGAREGGTGSWLLLLLCGAGIPWYDYLPVLTYGLNYIWTATATVWASVALTSPSLSRPRRVWGCVLCFVAGWMHEGFGIPLSAGAVVLLAASPPPGRRRILPLVAATVLGTSMTALSPAIWHRLAYMLSAQAPAARHYPLREAVMQFAPAATAAGAYALSVAVSLRRLPKERRPRIWFFTTFILAAGAVCIAFYCGPRTAMPLILLSGIGTVALLREAFPSLRGRFLILRRCFAATTALLLTVHMWGCCRLQRNLEKEYYSIAAAYRASSDGQVYADLIHPRPDITLFCSTVRQFHEHTPVRFFSRYHGRGSEQDLVVLPEKMRSFSPAEAISSRNTPGLLVYRGFLILTPEAADSFPDGGTLTLITASGQRIGSRYRLHPFTAAADGRRYVLVTPHATVTDPSLVPSDAIIAAP